MSVDHSSANGPVPAATTGQTIPPTSLRSLFVWFIEGFWVPRLLINGTYQHQRDRLRRGMLIHAVIAFICLTAFPTAVSPLEFAAVFLGSVFFLRLPRTFFLNLYGLLQPLPLLILLWTAWLALSLLWTPDVPQGLDQLASNRWAGTIMYLWAVVAFRRHFITALAIGFLLGNLAQAVHFASGGAAWLPWDHNPNRYSGWWGPAVAGSLLTAALGLHLPAAVMGRGRTRVLALAAAAVTIAGLIATGTRSGWIASAALIAVTVLLALVIHPRRRTVLATLGVFVVALVAAVLIFRAPLMARVNEARTEIAAALEEGEYRSPTGARIAMAGWAVKAFAAHPVRGVGVGGYKAWADDQLRAAGIDPAERSIHDHAHNTILHIAATNGLIGLAIAGAITLLAFRNAIAPLTRESIGTYAAAPAFALLGLLFVSAFDTVHINAQTAALLGVLFALSPTYVPPRERSTTTPAAQARGATNPT